MMLDRREWFAAQDGQVNRYLAYDASPQFGVEIFATVERVVSLGTAESGLVSGRSGLVVDIRSLPLAVLGQGRAGAADKAQSLVHQTWLDYGPTVSSVRAANFCVRQCLTDMGTEFAVSEGRDLVPLWIGQGSGVEERATEVNYMYPRAMQTPGTQHILDGSLKKAIESLPWWPEWSEQCKAITQWIHKLGHRQALQGLLRRGRHGQHFIDALSKTVDSFAKWRWTTLDRVLRGLALVEEALQLAVRELRSVAELACRESGQATAFVQAVRNDVFWRRVSRLSAGVFKAAEFSGWLKGCSCHEAERMARQVVDCPWAGCRAPELAAKVQELLADIQWQGQLDAHHAQPEWGQQLCAAWLRAYAYLSAKLGWVFSDPYRIWQVRLERLS